jgi:hypothetical protein
MAATANDCEAGHKPGRTCNAPTTRRCLSAAFFVLSVPERHAMRKAVHIRIRLNEAEGHHVREICLKENRSQSATVSLLVSEALAARRAKAAEAAEIAEAGTAAILEHRLTRLLRGEPDAAA